MKKFNMLVSFVAPNEGHAAGLASLIGGLARTSELAKTFADNIEFGAPELESESEDNTAKVIAVLQTALPYIQRVAATQPFTETRVLRQRQAVKDVQAINEALGLLQPAVVEGPDESDGCTDPTGHSWVNRDDDPEVAYCEHCGADGNA